jgi:hypothetical protein
MMLHQGWIGSFVQGLIMGAGMAVAMMVAELARRAGRARWAGRAGRLTRHGEGAA